MVCGRLGHRQVLGSLLESLALWGQAGGEGLWEELLLSLWRAGHALGTQAQQDRSAHEQGDMP